MSIIQSINIFNIFIIYICKQSILDKYKSHYAKISISLFIKL